MSHQTGFGVVSVTTPAPTDEWHDSCHKQLERRKFERTASESSDKFSDSETTLSHSRSGDRVSRAASTLVGSQSHIDAINAASFNHSPGPHSPRSVITPSSSDLSGDDQPHSARDHGSIARNAGIDVEASQPLARDAFRRELGQTHIDADYFAARSPWTPTTPAGSSAAVYEDQVVPAVPASAPAPAPAPAAAAAATSVAPVTLAQIEHRCPAAAPATVGSVECPSGLNPVARHALHAAAEEVARHRGSLDQSIAALSASGVCTRNALNLDDLARQHGAEAREPPRLARSALKNALAAAASAPAPTLALQTPETAGASAASAAPAAASLEALPEPTVPAPTAADADAACAGVVASVDEALGVDWTESGVPSTIAALRDSDSAPLSMPELVLVIKALMQDGAANADLDKVMSAMKRYSAEGKDWQRYAFTDPAVRYTRNLVTTDNKYWTLLLLCWNPGKESPVHNHPDCECFVRCVAGSVSETLYAWPAPGTAPEAPLEVLSEQVCGAGGVTFMNDEKGLHKLGNAGDEIAVTLHLYFPPYQSFKMFLDCTARASEGVSCLSSSYGEACNNLAMARYGCSGTAGSGASSPAAPEKEGEQGPEKAE